MSKHFTTIRSEDDIFIALHYSRLLMDQLSFSEMDKQKVLVSVSELTRNILDHANRNGSFSCEIIDNSGILLIFNDRGNGIEHVNEILKGVKLAKSHGLGLGLAGANRLLDRFSIETSKEGTKIVGIKWRY